MEPTDPRKYSHDTGRNSSSACPAEHNSNQCGIGPEHQHCCCCWLGSPQSRILMMKEIEGKILDPPNPVWTSRSTTNVWKTKSGTRENPRNPLYPQNWIPDYEWEHLTPPGAPWKSPNPGGVQHSVGGRKRKNWLQGLESVQTPVSLDTSTSADHDPDTNVPLTINSHLEDQWVSKWENIKGHTSN